MINSQRISPGQDAEDAVAGLVAGEPATAALWGMTYQVFGGRPGWALYRDESDQFAWFFGWEGQGLLVVSVEPYGIECFHWRDDASQTVNSPHDLWEWAKAREDAEEEAGVRDLIELRSQMRHSEDDRMAAELPADS